MRPDPKRLKIPATRSVDNASQLQLRIDALETRNALITQALRRILEGNLAGPVGAAADVVALEGGQTAITIAPFVFDA